LAGVVVVPDCGGERQQALQHPDEHSAGGVPAVQFQVELAFEGVKDRLDGLAQRFEQRRPGAFGFAAAGPAQQGQPGVGELGFEAAAV
jgi:hypothetical protein